MAEQMRSENQEPREYSAPVREAMGRRKVRTVSPDFLAGMREAQNIAWQMHKHCGREKMTALDAHDAIGREADRLSRSRHSELTGEGNAP